MLHARQHLAFSCSITDELVGNDHSWDVGAAFEQFPEKLLGCGLVPPALDEYIENVPVLVNRTPELGCLAVDLQKYFSKVPFVSSLRASSTELSGILLAEFPASHGAKGPGMPGHSFVRCPGAYGPPSGLYRRRSMATILLALPRARRALSNGPLYRVYRTGRGRLRGMHSDVRHQCRPNRSRARS